MNKVDVDNLRENLKELIKNNRLKLKPRQRFRMEKHNVSPKEGTRLH